MSRYSFEHKQETHQNILKTAGKLFREQGVVATGVQKLMKAVGLTQGGFYGHFPSKDGLLKEVIIGAFTQNRKQFLQGLEDKEGLPWLQEIIRRFINRTHRDEMGDSCPTTSLATEIARSSSDVKEVFEAEILKTIEALEKKMPKTQSTSSRERAFATISLGIGAIILARAVRDPILSDYILKAARKFAVDEFRRLQFGPVVFKDEINY